MCIRDRKSGVELKADFLEYLEDNEIDLVSKAKGILKLSDVFVYPVLKGESIMMWLLHVPCCPFFNQHPFFNQMTGKIFYAKIEL